MDKKIEWHFVKGKTDDAMINSVEKTLEITFPDDYLHFIQLYPRGYPYPYNVIKDKRYPDGQVSFTALIPLNTDAKGNLLQTYRNLNLHSGGDNQVPDGIIPFAFADNNYICFDYRKGFPPSIVFLDLGKHWEYLNYIDDPEFCKEVKEEDYLIYVCDSFTELLDMLEEEPKDE